MSHSGSWVESRVGIHAHFPYWESPADLTLHTSGPDCILNEFLYLGDLEASNRETLEDHGITHVVSVVSEYTIPFVPNHLPKAQHLKLVVNDTPTQSMVQVFPVTNAFLERCRKNDARVLVHCSAGISRSSTVILAYLMLHRGMSLESAYQHVRSIRPVICPNLGFMHQLWALDQSLTT